MQAQSLNCTHMQLFLFLVEIHLIIFLIQVIKNAYLCFLAGCLTPFSRG